MQDQKNAHAKLVPRSKLNNVQLGQSMCHPTMHTKRAKLNTQARPQFVQAKLNKLTPPEPPLTKLNLVTAPERMETDPEL